MENEASKSVIGIKYDPELDLLFPRIVHLLRDNPLTGLDPEEIAKNLIQQLINKARNENNS